MIVVQEKKVGNEIYFEVNYFIDDKIMNTNEIYYRTASVELDNKTYLMLYDYEMNPISEVFQFLNYSNFNQSINSKIKSLQALKLLFCFQSIINNSLEDFSQIDVNNLKLFLKGTISKGTTISFDLKTMRSNKTVNEYLSVYRSYLKFLGKNNKALFDSKTVTATIIAGADYMVDTQTNQFASNEKVPDKTVEVPRYISVEEFKRILTEIRQHYSVREEIIVRLMFQCGLRLGEVLGATADDFVVDEVINEQNDVLYVPTLYIRNRTSDQNYQCAKTCMKVSDVKQYQSKEYKTKDYGYQTVIVPEDLFDLINEYIEKEHLSARKKHKKNYYNSAIADRVRNREPYEDDNYYVFINSLGRPLSATSWNYILRDIFKACTIELDKGTKEHNLNHRFRHGFAMFNVQYLGCKEVELKERLRHHNLGSVAHYFRPTISDMIQVKTQFVQDLYKIIPELERS